MTGTAPFLTFYGDDFTGSTDALDALARGGAHGLLLTRVPSDAKRLALAGYDAIGLAGTSRSLPPEAMRRELSQAFAALRAIGGRICHYKTCSTFDSAPTLGSIGVAIEEGRAAFGANSVPILAAAPGLRRYMAFGHLFAGVSDETEIYRIDRHPIMSCHPATPMHEADLRRHLSRQTDLPVGLVTLPDIEGLPLSKLVEHVSAAPGPIFLDAISDRHLRTFGEIVREMAMHAPLFVAGSSGVEAALTLSGWPRQKAGNPIVADAPERIDSPIVVVSGSCSETTLKQIGHAEENGFGSIAIPAPAMWLEGREREDLRNELEQAALAEIASGRSIVLHTARGRGDPRIAEANSRMVAGDTARILGSFIGELARGVIDKALLSRICIAGGDTSSHAVRALGIDALEMVAFHAPGAPLCRAVTFGDGAPPFEIALKGGQMGGADYFTRLGPAGSKVSPTSADTADEGKWICS